MNINSSSQYDNPAPQDLTVELPQLLALVSFVQLIPQIILNVELCF
jgi:hypothetical protein